MRATSQMIRYAAGVTAILLSLACKDSTGPVGPKVGSVSVSASRTALEIGDSVQLAATVLDENGVTMSGRSVTWSSSNSVVASVGASGLVSARSGGATFVRVASGERSDSVEISVRPGTCTIANATGTITLGQPQSGSHTASDCLYEGQSADGWRFDLASATILNINLTSPSGLVELIVTDMQLNVVAYGYGNGTSSQVVAPFAPGSYVIWPRAPYDVPLGNYEIAAQLHQTPPCSVAAGSIAVGQTVTSQIEDSDCAFLPNQYADSWQLSLATQTTLQIDVASDEFDAVLLVTSAVGQWLAFDDDGGGYPNSRLVITLPPGDYLVVASTYSPLATGSYQLAVQSASGASPRRSSGTATFNRRGIRLAAGESRADAWPVGDKRGSR